MNNNLKSLRLHQSDVNTQSLQNQPPPLINSVLGDDKKSRPGQDFPLSNAHIRPRINSASVEKPTIEYVKGGSLFRTSKNRNCQAVGGGKRGGINGFSNNSRRRLLELIATVRRDSELPSFVTLTYPANFPTVKKSKRDLKIFLQRLERKFPEIGVIWKLEPQERGAPHFHLLAWGVESSVLLTFVVQTWYEVAGDGDENHFKFHLGLLHGSVPCVSKVRSFKGVWAYAAKYLGKTFQVAGWSETWTGRFWGVLNRENIPFGEMETIEVDRKTAYQVIRLQRRFMHMKKARDFNSLKTFCDADQWVIKLLGVGTQ